MGIRWVGLKSRVLAGSAGTGDINGSVGLHGLMRWSLSLAALLAEQTLPASPIPIHTQGVLRSILSLQKPRLGTRAASPLDTRHGNEYAHFVTKTLCCA